MRNLQVGGQAYSEFTASLTTVLQPSAVPVAPANLRINGAATATTVPVQFDAVPSSPAVVEYRLYESGTYRATVAAPATSGTLGDYGAGSPYNITVTAVSTEGESGPSNELKGTTLPNPPTVPQNARLDLAVTPNPTATTVALAWDAVADATQCKIYEGTSTVKATVDAPATKGLAGGYTANSPYSLTVTAVNAGGESGRSTPDVAGNTAPAARARKAA